MTQACHSKKALGYLLGWVFMSVFMASPARADFLGDFYSFNTELLGEEARLSASSEQLPSALKRLYSELGAKHPGFKNEIAAREKARVWAGDSPTASQLEAKIREVSANKLVLSKVSEDSYDGSRIIALYAQNLVNQAKKQEYQYQPAIRL